MIYPMFTMVILTFIVGCLAAKCRFSSLRSGEINLKYFKLMAGQDVPELVTKTTRCFNNMFEIPVLFYVACSLYLSLGIDSLVGIVFAWLFVALRVAQVYIHITYNQIIHRMSAFWGAFLCVMVLWTNLLVLQM